MSAQRDRAPADGPRMSEEDDAKRRRGAPLRPARPELHTPTFPARRDELRDLVVARHTPVPELRRSARGIEALRHYVVLWGPDLRPNVASPLGDTEDRVLRFQQAEHLDSELPAGCTIAGAIVDEDLEEPPAVDLLATTRRRWPRVPLLVIGRKRAATEQRALGLNGLFAADRRAPDLHEQIRVFVHDAITQRLAQCTALETRMAGWDLTEKEAQMLVLLAVGMDEASLPAALETSSAYVASLRRSVLEKTEADDLFGVMARLAL